MQNMKIVLKLSGIPGSGKTTLAKILSQRYQFKDIYVDTFYNSVSRIDTSVVWFRDKK